MSEAATATPSERAASGSIVRPAAAAAQHASATVRRLLEQLSLRSAREPRIARVYDGCTDGRPWFDAEHPVIVDAHERELILGRLRAGGIILRAAGPLRDEINGQHRTVPADLRSDGVWIWSDAVSYYLDNHWIAPDPELMAHLATSKPAALTDDTWRRLYSAIRPDTWEGTTWPLD